MPQMPPESDFISVPESLNFLQQVKDPTHNHGCTLNSVFILGMALSSLKLDDFISDHKCIMFHTYFHTYLFFFFFYTQSF